MKKNTLQLSAALLALFGLFGAAPLVSAAEPTNANEENILLSPTKKRYEMKAGESKQDSMKVVNDGPRPISFIVYARPYSVINENYDPNYDSNSKNADAYKWIQFDTASYELEPGQSADISYTVRVPQNAAPGGHYGVLFAETQVTSQPSGTSIVQKKRVGSIMYITVDGDVTTSGKLIGGTVPFFQTKAPISIKQRVQNNGNTDFVVNSTTNVSDIFGGVKFKNQKESAVLPETTRAIDNDWINPAWIGLYKVEQTVSFLSTSKTMTNYVLFVPVWVYLTLALLIGARVLYAVAHRKRKK